MFHYVHLHSSIAEAIESLVIEEAPINEPSDMCYRGFFVTIFISNVFSYEKVVISDRTFFFTVGVEYFFTFFHQSRNNVAKFPKLIASFWIFIIHDV